ncbi:hypothetical protein [Pedobacter nototheniae]|uniref:hypothetical protein n=1 Tax=Pedobacter nototheniae TaxID=2488994 RepID=UPI00292D815C|nr:hypothetical protein [Pedobacter nototheniae]
MKIFNVQPIQVIEYILNEEHLDKSHKNYSYESGFGFTGRVIESLNTMIITFGINYTIDDDHCASNVYPSNSNKFSIQVEGEIGDGEIFFSYSSSCQFNFKSEGFEEDLQSMIEFLDGYYEHTQTFLTQYAPIQLKAKEEEIRMKHTLKANALAAIENLRENNMYQF